MTNKTRIDVGDHVRVRFGNITSVYGEVLYTPQATGDSWIIRDRFTGNPVHVQTFCAMEIDEPES